MRPLLDVLKNLIYVASMVVEFVFLPLVALYWFVWGDVRKGFIFTSFFTVGLLIVLLIHRRSKKKTEALFAEMLAEREKEPVEDQLPESLRDEMPSYVMRKLKATPHNHCASDAQSDFSSDCLNSTPPCWCKARRIWVI